MRAESTASSSGIARAKERESRDLSIICTILPSALFGSPPSDNAGWTSSDVMHPLNTESEAAAARRTDASFASKNAQAAFQTFPNSLVFSFSSAAVSAVPSRPSHAGAVVVVEEEEAVYAGCIAAAMSLSWSVTDARCGRNRDALI